MNGKYKYLKNVFKSTILYFKHIISVVHTKFQNGKYIQ